MDIFASHSEKLSSVLNCPVCSSEKRKFLFETTRDEIKSFIYRCNNCRLVYNGVSLENKQDSEYLKDKFSENYNERYTMQYAHAKAYMRVLQSKVKGRTMLDIGCGPGFFMLAAKEREFNPIGVEPFGPSARIAKENGLKVINKFLSDTTFPKKTFDLILAIEVIEHFRDPVAEFKVISDIIKDDGLIVLQTANQNSLAGWIKGKCRNYYYYDHLCYFSPKTLEYALNKVGLQIVDKYAGIVPFWAHLKSAQTWKKKWQVLKIHFFRALVFNRPILSSMTVFVKKRVIV